MTPQDMDTRIGRYGNLMPCKTAFIDAHIPGSDQNENVTTLGDGLSESPDQHVHISIPHGFTIGATGQPPRRRNALRDHNTAFPSSTGEALLFHILATDDPEGPTWTI